MRKKFLTDKRIELFIRFWAAGAVYFFIGWGTGVGLGSVLDFIFVLGIVMAIVEMFVVNPIIRLMLHTKSVTRYMDTTIFNKVKYRLLYILKTMFIMSIVTAIYEIINRGTISLLGLPSETVVLPGEPILFGVFYIITVRLLNTFINNIKDKMKDVNENDK